MISQKSFKTTQNRHRPVASSICLLARVTGIHLTLDLAGNAKFGPDVEWLTLEGQEEIDSSVYAVNEERQEHFVEKIASYLPLIYDNKNR